MLPFIPLHICLEQGANDVPADATATYSFICCFIKIQTGLTFQVLAYLVVLEKRPLNGYLAVCPKSNTFSEFL